MSSELPRSVIKCLWLILESFQPLWLHIFLLFLSSPPGIPIKHMLQFYSCFIVFGCSRTFFSPLRFNLVHLYWPILDLSTSILRHTQSTDERNKDTLPFCLWFLTFPLILSYSFHFYTYITHLFLRVVCFFL